MPDSKVKKIVRKICAMQDEATEILKKKPNWEKDCRCEAKTDTWTYHEWDFSNQDMLYKVCLDCGGNVEID